MKKYGLTKAWPHSILATHGEVISCRLIARNFNIVDDRWWVWFHLAERSYSSDLLLFQCPDINCYGEVCVCDGASKVSQLSEMARGMKEKKKQAGAELCQAQ